MGWFDFIFSRAATCPNCGDPRARRSLFGGIRCPNLACDHFDLELMHGQSESFGPGSPSTDFPAPAGVGGARQTQRSALPTPLSGSFDPGPNLIEVQYQNFRGEQRTFQGDNRTVRRRGNHLSLLVAPTGARIALDRDRIQNLAELEACVRAWPTPREAHVLRYHVRRGTTSPLFEQLRRKFPDWRPS